MEAAPCSGNIAALSGHEHHNNRYITGWKSWKGHWGLKLTSCCIHCAVCKQPQHTCCRRQKEVSRCARPFPEYLRSESHHHYSCFCSMDDAELIKKAGRNIKASCDPSILSWGICHQDPDCKMTGTEQYLCDGKQGEWLSAGAVSPSLAALLPQAAAMPVWGDRGYFISRYPSGCTADSTDTLKHFLDIKSAQTIGTIVFRIHLILPALVSPEGCLHFPKGA